MVRATTLGFPRIGPDRELKSVLEAYWAGEGDEQQLRDTARDIRREHFGRAVDADLDSVPTGDFTFYDHVLDTAVMVGAVPPRFGAWQGLDTYFAMARGGDQARPLEMTKWFDTNYHYLVPELHADVDFRLRPDAQLAQLRQAHDAGVEARPVILGPVSFLLLSKGVDVEPLDLLDDLVEVYCQLLGTLQQAGATQVQIDEPCVVTRRSSVELERLEAAWSRLAAASDLELTLATYFAGVDIGDNLERVLALPADEFHLDLVRAPDQLAPALKRLGARDDKPGLSLGLVDGRNVWVTDLDRALTVVDRAIAELGEDRVTVAPSCSLLHVPYTTAGDTGIDEQIRPWLAFAYEKLEELAVLKAAADAEGSDRDRLLADNRDARDARRRASATNDPDVDRRLGGLGSDDYQRPSPYHERRDAQRGRLNLPVLPTTTVGSYPQTGEIRRTRAQHRRGEIATADYEDFLRSEIQAMIDFQEETGLDVLVHGEPERNDMVQYFAERMRGFALSSGGWVQSYGSRCVRPPILYGDVSRPEPITVRWWRHAQSLSEKPVKGMLTGPVTILQWSFVRDDQPAAETCRQIGLAIRDEVDDLVEAGAPVVQIDEPALREGLPLHDTDHDGYLRWAVDCFRLAAAAVPDDIQVHTHMCYADFAGVIEHIARMDADVLLVEASRSDMELLEVFADYDYPNAIGPGVYDIHSPRVPSVDEIEQLLMAARKRLSPDQLWVVPDCGLKTRRWEQITPALENLVTAAHNQREEIDTGA